MPFRVIPGEVVIGQPAVVGEAQGLCEGIRSRTLAESFFERPRVEDARAGLACKERQRDAEVFLELGVRHLALYNDLFLPRTTVLAEPSVAAMDRKLPTVVFTEYPMHKRAAIGGDEIVVCAERFALGHQRDPTIK